MLSVTVKVAVKFPAGATGVPVTAPVDAFNDNPAGKAPVKSVQVNGAVPPVAERVEV